MLEGDHYVVGDEVCYLDHEVVLVLAEEIEVLLCGRVALYCHHEDADVCCEGEYRVGCLRE